MALIQLHDSLVMALPWDSISYITSQLAYSYDKIERVQRYYFESFVSNQTPLP